jgi:hypothetical protein
VITFVLTKWLDPKYRWNRLYLYTADDVNRMASMLARNVTLPHRVVCFTDDSAGIDSAIETHPIWADWTARGQCYRRLRLFSDEEWLQEIVGERFWSIDLDAVITGNIDHLLTETADFAAYRNIMVTHHHYCGALWMLRTGSNPHVYHTFNKDVLRAVDLERKHWNGSDQVWMSIQLGPHFPTWGPEHGIRHYKLECTGDQLPPDTRVVLFNGAVSPAMPELQRRHPWIQEHWR